MEEQKCIYPPVINTSSLAEADRERVQLLENHFKKCFNSKPDFFVRVPGRVNLIGEHVDYCGFSVCPMAVEQDIILAAQASDGRHFLELKNVDSETYPDFYCQRNFKIDIANGWSSYFLCGLKGSMDTLTSVPNNGMKVLVQGTIPPGSGLSSSSALVCAAFLCSNEIFKVKMSKTEIASLSALCEQYIGTAGGGMDQAIAILANKGCAKHIMFCPLSTEEVTLPSDATFIIAHSGVVKNKAASSEFNSRVVECRLVAQIIAKRSSFNNWKIITKLSDVQSMLNWSFSEIIKYVEDNIHDGPYSKAEICSELGVAEKELSEISLTANTVSIENFVLKPRALHVFQEASRVREWCHGCRSGWTLEELGKLMTASHKSLRDLYQCSHPLLDKLVECCLDSGAFGARLTGAGWGGCVVALTTKSNADSFIKSVKEKFYKINDSGASLIFATSPSQGAEIIVPEC